MKRSQLARNLRVKMTDAERRLWSRLRNRQLFGYKFRRQMPIEGFIADFACIEAKLIIELDGGHHAEMIEADGVRSDAIESAGFLVMRFWNSDVLRNIDSVLGTIAGLLETRAPR